MNLYAHGTFFNASCFRDLLRIICVSVPLQQRLQGKGWHDAIREGQCACVPPWYNGDQVHAGSIIQAGPQKVSFLT